MTRVGIPKARILLACSLMAAAVAFIGCGGGDDGGAAADAAPLPEPDASAAQCTIIGTETGKFSFGTDTCNTCMSTSCCNQVVACFTDMVGGGLPCADLLKCVAACVVAGGARQPCVIDCATQNSAGVPDGLAVQNCTQASCSASCPQ
jgi:hypothetical protein